MTTTVTSFVWFDSEAEQAAEYYVRQIADSKITGITRNPDGSAFVVELSLAGHSVTLINAGPGHPHTDAFSLQVVVDGQAEVDRLWTALAADGGKPGPCGWLTDRWGLSWQVVPSELPALMGENPVGVGTVLRTMSKLDIEALRAAARG